MLYEIYLIPIFDWIDHTNGIVKVFILPRMQILFQIVYYCVPLAWFKQDQTGSNF